MGIVFAGSDPSTMRMLFSDRAQPFFAQADLIEIGPLTDDELTSIVEAGFDATGRGVGTVTGRLVAVADGIPSAACNSPMRSGNEPTPGSSADAVDVGDGPGRCPFDGRRRIRAPPLTPPAGP